MAPPAILERAASQNLLDYVHALQRIAPECGFRALPCAGGVAAYAGHGSPLTTVKGAGPALEEADITRAEEFFLAHAVDGVVFELAPWIAPETSARLFERGYRAQDGENLVVRLAPFDAPPPDGSVRPMDSSTWAGLMWEAFGLPETRDWRHLAAASALLPGAINLGVYDAGWIACAQLVPSAGVALFACDGTLPSARGRGAQSRLIDERLRLAAALGLRCAVAEVAAGSASERNYIRHGFRRAYFRSYYMRPHP